jgi:hypothetical protein
MFTKQKLANTALMKTLLILVKTAKLRLMKYLSMGILILAVTILTHLLFEAVIGYLKEMLILYRLTTT